MKQPRHVVWSASPTPFTDALEVDEESVRRMVEHQIRLGISGLFLAGTNGEGPWMPDRQRSALVRTAARAARGRLPLAVQVTDNSSARILDNIRQAARDGAGIAVIAPPALPPRDGNADALLALYLGAIRRSPLPIGIYDRRMAGGGFVPEAVLRAVLAEPRVALLKDSSADPARQRLALAAKRRRPALQLLNGWEFDCVSYLKAGYGGLLLGGGVFNGFMAARLAEAAEAADWALAERIQARMNRLMWAVYGGRKIACWLSGEKHLLVRLGVFSTWKNYPAYPLTPACRRAIDRALVRERAWLLP